MNTDEGEASRIAGLLLAAVALYIAGGYFGLYFPDTDFLLMPILHHRSIVTHGLIVPLVLLALLTVRRKRIGEYPFLLGQSFLLGVCGGISIHLAADVMSPMRGFALIYLPISIKSIGAVQSITWMVVNGVFAAYLGLSLSNRLLPALAVGFTITATAYAVYNENDITALLPCLAFGAIALAVRKSPPDRRRATSFDCMLDRLLHRK